MTIAESVRSFLNSTFLIGENVLEEESFTEKNYIDSTGFLELITFIGSEFNIKINDIDISPDNFDSIRGIINFVSSKRGH